MSSLPWHPHPYQQKAVEFCLERPAAGLFLDPGLGKTSSTLKVLQHLDGPALVLAPLRVARHVWRQEALKWRDFHSMKVSLLHGPDRDAKLRDGADIFVTNYESLPWLTAQQQWKRLKARTLVVDECFPAGTHITAQQGEVPIETLAPGDCVLTSHGWQSILHLGTRTTDALVELEFSDGRTLRCTPDHPIFTDLGWIPAAHTEARRVFAHRDLSDLRFYLSGCEKLDLPRPEPEMLLSILCSESNVECPPGKARGVCANHAEASDALPGVEQGKGVVGGASGEDVGRRQISGSDDSVSGWERPRNDEGGSPRRSSLADRIRVELSGKVGEAAARLSHQLQSRFWGADSQDRLGGGWIESQLHRAPAVGSEEGGATRGTRVVRVTHLQCGSPTTVYNLTVAGAPHFYAEGVLVHNSSKLKNNDTQRFRLLKPKLTSFDRRYILTGSPAPNSLMDLWSQIFLLDLGKALSPFITHFRAMHFHPLEYGWVLKPGHEEIIYEAIADLCLRLDADDYLTLPQRVTSTVLVDLPDSVRSIYDEVETEFFAQLDTFDIMASNKGGALTKCRQIAAGAVYTDFQCTQWEALHDAKLEATRDRLEEIGGHPTLIAYQFQHSLARLRDMFWAQYGYAMPALPARTPREEDDIIARWNAGEIPVLLGQPASMGHGLNLQGAAHHVIFYDLPWNFDDYDQTIRRLQRQGQTHDTVFVTHLEADHTVDQAISRALVKKDTSQRGLLQYLKEYRDA